MIGIPFAWRLASGIVWTFALKTRPRFVKKSAQSFEDTFWSGVSLEDLYDRVGAIAGSGLDNLIRIMKDDGDVDGSIDLARFADLSILSPK